MLLFPVLATIIALFMLAPAIEYIGTTPTNGHIPSLRRWLLDALCATVGYGGWLAITGSCAVSIIMMLILLVVTIISSNIKYRILGEPLLFSDLVVARSFLQHPKFYLFSIPATARVALVLLTIIIPAILWISASNAPRPHLAGIIIMMAGCLLLALLPARKWASVPDIERDVTRLGLPGSVLLYWRQWRTSPDLPPALPLHGQPAYDQIIIVQCESFTDPATLNLPADIPLPAMPGLQRAYAMATHRGELHVSGFGAYTMRSEYGVIFGQEESELGFRRYDPFLTVRRERLHALGVRLKEVGYDSAFVHPHDLKFYDRETLMPLMGFSRLISPGPHIPTPDMPYFEDVALGQVLADMIGSTSTPSLTYTVTMENHGPWPAGKDKYAPLHHYLRHLKNSDQMLLNLISEILQKNQRTLLVFFGDHRPSIPNVITPTVRRDVPYVVMSFPQSGNTVPSTPVSRTPAQLNHLIVQMAVRPEEQEGR